MCCLGEELLVAVEVMSRKEKSQLAVWLLTARSTRWLVSVFVGEHHWHTRDFRGKTRKWGNNERDSGELISNEAQKKKENRLQTMNRSFFSQLVGGA